MNHHKFAETKDMKSLAANFDEQYSLLTKLNGYRKQLIIATEVLPPYLEEHIKVEQQKFHGLVKQYLSIIALKEHYHFKYT